MGSSFSMVGGGMSPEDTCVICGERGADEETGVEQVQICPIGHYAHIDCITPWYAKADTCPECRVNVRDFPLWKDINPDGPVLAVQGELMQLQQPVQPEEHVYDFNNIEIVMNANRRFMDMRDNNDYTIALEYFNSPEGSAYLNFLIQEDAAQLSYLINVEDEDPDEVDTKPLIYHLMNNNLFNVANALYDYATMHRLVDDLVESSGPVINNFDASTRRGLRIINWLHSNGFRVGFSFLETAAFSHGDIDSVRWYFEYIRPERNDARILALYETLAEDVDEESDNEIYEIFKDYIEQEDMQIQQTGGMWQRGGFFMTCS